MEHQNIQHPEPLRIGPLYVLGAIFVAAAVVVLLLIGAVIPPSIKSSCEK